MRNREIVTGFRKASASQGGQQECVEVASTADGGRAVRDSKNPGLGIQFYDPHAWDSFISGLRTGEFEH
ncbi:MULTISPECIES: DUF397 domain-containing protein [Streptomyces]|uniref:DUF397 domain-containing protein n=2 Tax=Streptomyces TaxID=1883 RepID=A0A420V111_9ACTN|nr:MULTISPECIES: DUF397 domain-containing protein [Streptomyces]KNE80176.1 hypothetical protein ADZ36_23475 [Streptomyces fradiae]OFA40076.1 DUF397 domain-containing protein [Streptomyces fradiae]PQM21631.1 DUF397 domain-containing protein [Streptomyces xinghaiensis]RKM94306.1 DUF397 domain-containing protein [Streptomyces xinghaiensis]RNC71906.1 DUF397 domain-containing protein [Streptomyces xinghaiensis]